MLTREKRSVVVVVVDVDVDVDIIDDVRCVRG